MKPLVILDPGHGGHDPGAVGPTGLREADVALDVAERIAKELAPYPIAVFLTRNSDLFCALDERAAFANIRRADLFLSIHCNASETHAAAGYEVWTTPGNTKADAFATKLYMAYAAAFPGLRGRTDMADGDQDKEAAFAVLRLTACPAALFELEFIDSPGGEAWLAHPSNLDLAARALAGGILAHHGLRATPTPIPAEPAAPPAPAGETPAPAAPAVPADLTDVLAIAAHARAILALVDPTFQATT